MNSALKSGVGAVVASKRVRMADLAEMAINGRALQGEVRLRSLAPTNEKRVPYFTQQEVCDILGKDLNWMSYRLRSGDEPRPEMHERKNRFSLEATQVWTRRHRKAFMRPDGQKAMVLATGNFKGGSTKTTTAVTTAQGLSIKGHKVLLVDLDPQASASYLMGVIPELDYVLTLLPVFQGTADSAAPMIRKTYWSGIDLIAASPLMAQADSDVVNHPSGRWWEVLRNALAPVLDDYDVVVLDTGPTLSPLTVTAFMAADGLLVPITPNALDFASSAQFWTLFADMHATFQSVGVEPKDYEFVKVLLSRVDSNDTATATIREFLNLAYGDQVMEVEVPKSNVMTSSSLAFGTVFDTQMNRSSRAAFVRCKEAFEAVVDQIEYAICAAWARRVNEGV